MSKTGWCIIALFQLPICMEEFYSRNLIKEKTVVLVQKSFLLFNFSWLNLPILKIDNSLANKKFI